MITLLEFLLAGVAFLIFVPVTILFVEVLLAVTDVGSSDLQERTRRRLAVLIPAHNEASLIAGTIRGILPHLVTHDRLLVIADNCSDDTAAIAAAEGAEVAARTDDSRRGKGYALDFGIRHLEADAPDIVVIVDADCEVTAGSIDRLARVCGFTSRPTQALYLMHSPPNSGLKTRTAELAWAIKNQVRPIGLRRLRLPCQLMGTGMAFPWSCISKAKLATGHLVEDLKLGIELTYAGTPPLFCPEAVVTSQFPVSTTGIQSQRLRWEHGYLGVLMNDAPRLFINSILTMNADMMALALDLSIPPLALLALQITIVWCVSLFLYLLTRERISLIILTTAAVFLALSVLLSWKRYGRHIISFVSLSLSPFYALSKVPLYARFLVARQHNWIRSRRDPDEPPTRN